MLSLKQKKQKEAYISDIETSPITKPSTEKDKIKDNVDITKIQEKLRE